MRRSFVSLIGSLGFQKRFNTCRRRFLVFWKAGLVKKAGKLRYGYKQHTDADENGLVLDMVTTSANQIDINHLEDLLEIINPKAKSCLKTDKGYTDKENDDVLSKRNLMKHILRKVTKGKPLTANKLKFNSLISKTRYKVERTIGLIKRWVKTGVARYVGLEKMHTQH